jgi:cytochrome d ubiquinol oxidase subunit I
MDVAFWHRLQFAFTATFHYLFPQLTMGLALLVFVMKTLGLGTRGQGWNDAARFWIRIFGINFAVGVVTGIPLEFQFGTNWAGFSRYAGGIVGQTLGMEGLFAFFLESSFLAVLVWGEHRVSHRGHWLAALALFLGSWLSGYFVVCTNAFLQHPVGYAFLPDGALRLASFSALVLNPWAIAQYLHTMMASVVTASFVVAAVGASYALRGVHAEAARRFLAVGVVAGLIACVLVAFPTGDRQAKLVAKHQPAALAAMEGRFESGPYARITIIGQPNVGAKRIDNPLQVPGMLSFLEFGALHTEVPGLNEFPPDRWAGNIELLYHASRWWPGTIFIGTMALATLLPARGQLTVRRCCGCSCSHSVSLHRNTAGWLTTELGRQPWAVYGLLRTYDASVRSSIRAVRCSRRSSSPAYVVLARFMPGVAGRARPGHTTPRGSAAARHVSAVVAIVADVHGVRRADGFDLVRRAPLHRGAHRQMSVVM